MEEKTRKEYLKKKNELTQEDKGKYIVSLQLSDTMYKKITTFETIYEFIEIFNNRLSDQKDGGLQPMALYEDLSNDLGYFRLFLDVEGVLQ